MTSVVAFFPLTTEAAKLQDLIVEVKRVIDLLLPVTVALALLVFFFGLLKYIARANDVASQKEGKSIMLGGIAALFVMVSIWGIIRFIGSAFSIGQGDNIKVPEIQTPSGRPSSGSNPVFPTIP